MPPLGVTSHVNQLTSARWEDVATKPTESFSARLRRCMDKKNMGVDELADKVGVTTKTVYAWLAGDIRPRPYRIATIASALGVSEEHLARPLYVEEATRALPGHRLTLDELDRRIAALEDAVKERPAKN